MVTRMGLGQDGVLTLPFRDVASIRSLTLLNLV